MSAWRLEVRATARKRADRTILRTSLSTSGFPAAFLTLGRLGDTVASVHFLCKNCNRRLSAVASSRASRCDQCGLDNSVEGPPAGQPVSVCAACQERELYIQKDFNPVTGVAIVAVGAVFVPWTYGLSLFALTLLDLVLYHKLGSVTVCYACRAVHRGYPLNPDHQAFDLAVHDRHVYGAAPPGAEERH
jgi:hypothetical protein